MSHISSKELISRIKEAREKVQVGEKYQHYKGSEYLYEVVGVALNESTEEACVLYKPLYGDLKGETWIRTLENFLEEVEFEGQKVQRFRKVIE